MKNIALLFALWLAFAGAVSAQINVEVLMDQDQFLPNESIPVKVRVINNSGQTLHFGAENWLHYSVEAQNGLVVLKTGDVPLPHDFTVDASEMATTHADLAPYFNLGSHGHYSITATVSIKDWNQQASSQPRSFDILSGNKIWEQAFGLPQSPTNHTPPEVRKYILQQATYVRHTMLYLRLTDAAEAHTLRVFPIGRVISFSDPQTRLDGDSNLHLLYQEGAHVYSYIVIDPDGEITVRQTYSYLNSAPRLRVDTDGNIQITGGVRRIADNDLPRTPSSVPTNDTPPRTP